jgi:ethanolamine ammonia-lyase small subunit
MPNARRINSATRLSDAIQPSREATAAKPASSRLTGYRPAASAPKSGDEGIAAPVTPDVWTHLRQFTSARIALGRCGGSQPTHAVLDFRASHARARDAVVASFDPRRVVEPLRTAGIDTEILATAAADRRTYLLRPDLGRQLAAESREKLAQLAVRVAGPDLVIIVSDGLAAAAAERHAAATLFPLLAELKNAKWKIGPVLVVPFARVKVQDEIGAALRARYSLILLGERPGLGAPDSLGAYFTAAPAPERTDADRNCISNIRPEGLPPAQAAAKLAWLLGESARTGLHGIHLKDNQPVGSLAG